MSPRERRPENEGLPTRWHYRHGAYYYWVPKGLEALWDGKHEFRLGTTLADAHRSWADRIEPTPGTLKTVADLLDRYALLVVPGKAPTTQRHNVAALKTLRAVLGHLPLSAITPQIGYKFLHLRSKGGARTAANRDYEVLQHAFTAAVQWGEIERNPLMGQVVKLKVRRQKRYVEDWEVDEALKASTPVERAYVAIKLLSGLRRTDMLRMRVSDLLPEGIGIKPSKTVNTTEHQYVLDWTPALRLAIDAALAARPVHIAPWVFCTRAGDPYQREDGKARAFDSLWQRFMGRALRTTGLKARFKERDLRAKVGSDAPTLERARELLGHASEETTRRWYRRRPQRVTPTR